MKPTTGKVALAAALIVSLGLLIADSRGNSPCRSSMALKLDGMCGAASFYLAGR